MLLSDHGSTFWSMIAIWTTLYFIIIDQAYGTWFILEESTDFYENDWDDIDRKWSEINHFYTHNGNHIQRKCTMYSDGNQLCLCQFALFYHINPHFCFSESMIHKLNTQSSFPLFFQQLPPSLNVIDSFPNQMNNKGTNIIASAIKSGVKYYIQHFENGEDIPMDSVFLLKLISKNNAQYKFIANEYYQSLQKAEDYNDPFCRIFSNSPANSQRFNDLKITRSVEPKKHGQHNIYSINKKYSQFYEDPTDDVVLKALFCDIKGYDKIDFDILMNMADYKGSYEDTHTIISLNFLLKNQCYDKNKIHSAMSNVAKAILNTLNTENNPFRDLFFEQIVSLYWSGYGDYVKKKWITKIAKHQNKDFGWSHDYQYFGKELVPIIMEQESDPHPTGLALLAMIYYEIGQSKQSFYPVEDL